MAYNSVYDDIVFVEGDCASVEDKGTVEYKGKSLFNRQLKNLDDVKAQLAAKAKKLGANAIKNFKYGQKQSGWFKSALLSLDDNVNWKATGTACVVSDTDYAKYIQSWTNR